MKKEGQDENELLNNHYGIKTIPSSSKSALQLSDLAI